MNFKRLLRIVFGRTTYLLLFLLIQIGILLACFQWLSQYMVYIYGGFTVLSAVVVIHILNKSGNPSFKMAWMIPVLVIPVFGVLFYAFVELNVETKIISKRLHVLLKESNFYLQQEDRVLNKLSEENISTANLAKYMKDFGGYPIYENTNVTYFRLGEDKLAELKIQLKQAKRFIFLEYFIIECGEMWDEILEILEQKVQEGVEVRVMYDGMCCLMLLPFHYPEKLEKMGIRCKMFSPIIPTLSTHQNNRDHRKIVVIDGHTAFTGGVNLADEYINRKVRFGHWKDTAIMLKGEAVKSFTMMFLQMWNISEDAHDDFSSYLADESELLSVAKNTDGYVIPYGDSPLDHETVGEYVYMDILNHAHHYVHIMTPYLILDQDMISALTYAAKRGVETIIIMPHIPDKMTAYLLARSHYQELILAGVQIYEYTPGFIHAKVFTSDDEKAVVGTINLDYRSLYLHFECAAYLYRCQVVLDIEQDFQETLRKCQRITLEECKNYPVLKKLAGSILRLFAPLM